MNLGMLLCSILLAMIHLYRKRKAVLLIYLYKMVEKFN